MNTLFTSILLILLSTMAVADEAKTYFVQYWTLPKDPRYKDEVELLYEEDPGHAQATIDGDTVSCVEAKAVPGWNNAQLAPVSTGFILVTKKIDKLKFTMDGATNSYMNIYHKIQEIPARKE